MSNLPIIDPEEEEKLDPHELSDILIKRVLLARKARVPINNQYKIDYQETLKDVKDGKCSFPLTHSELDHRASTFQLRKSAMGAATRNLMVVRSEELQKSTMEKVPEEFGEGPRESEESGDDKERDDGF